MYKLVIYIAALGMLLHQSGCLKMAQTPLTGSVQNRHSRWKTPRLGPMFYGEYVRSSHVMKHTGQHMTTSTFVNDNNDSTNLHVPTTAKKWTYANLGPMFHGGYFLKRPPVEPFGHDTTTKTRANVKKHNRTLSTTAKGMQNFYHTSVNKNGTETYVITTEKQLSGNKSTLGHANLWIIPSLKENVHTPPPLCSPESCHTRGLQSPSCSTEKCGDVHRTCKCDVLCVLFVDCCSDVLHIIPKQAVQKMLYYSFDWKKWFTDVDNVPLLSSYINWSTCLPIRSGSDPLSIRVIAKCPTSGNAGDTHVRHSLLSSLCEGSSNHHFVIKTLNVENTTIRVLFKNKYCVRCHGLTKSHTVFSKTALYHPQDSPYIPPLVAGIIRTCDVTAHNQNLNLPCVRDYHSYNLNTICSLNLFPIDVDINGKFNRSRCLHCNGTEREDECINVHFMQHGRPLGMMHGAPIVAENGYLLDSLFSFYNYPHVHTSTNTYTTINHYINRNVTDYPVLQCPLGFTKTGDTCKKQSNFQNDTIDLNITLQVNSQSHANNISVLQDLFAHAKLKFNLIDQKYENDQIENYYQVNLNDINLLLHLTDAAEKLFRNTDTEIIITTIDEAGTSFNCQDNQTDVVLFDVDLTTINTSLYITNKESTYTIPFPFSQFAINIDIHRNTSNSSELTLSYCSSDPDMMTNCSAVRVFPPGQFSVHNHTVRLYDAEKNVQEKVRHYTIMNHTLLVCDQRKPSVVDYSYLRKLAEYISNITMSFSIVALFLLVYYHFVIPRLLNLHGKIVVGFALSLAISQLILVTNTVMRSAKDYLETFPISNYICKVLGIINHYLLICMFLWSAIMSYDICRRFSACSPLHQQIDTDKGRYRFRIYTCIATLLPFMVVLISNILALLSEDFDLGYGDQFHCMVYTFEGKLYAFDIPVLSIYAFSIVCFVISLHGLECARRAGKHLYNTRKRDRRHLKAYSKITLMIGFTWVISIAGVFTQSVWLSFLGLFVNGLQGLQVFIGFLLNNQIRKVILARYCCPIKTNDSYAVYSTQSK